MTLKADMTAEAIALNADAALIENELTTLEDDRRAAAVQAMVEPRRRASAALRAAVSALEAIPPMGLGRRE